MSLAGWLNFDSLSIIKLATVLLSLAIFLYLLRVPHRSWSTLFLAGAILGGLLFNTASLFEFAGRYYWHRSLRFILVNLVNDVGLSLGVVSLVLFAYHFPRFRRAERTEFRIVLGTFIALSAGVLGLNVYDHLVLQWQRSDARLWDAYWTAFYLNLVVQFLGVIFLMFRKAVRLSGHGSLSLRSRLLHPEGRDAKAARSLALILLLPLLAVAASLGMTYALVPTSVATYLTWLGLLLFYLGFIVTYLNHGADPLTLQVKLQGVTLVIVLSTMGLVALFVGAAAVRDYVPRALPAEGSTLRFTPNVRGGYDVTAAPGSFDPHLGPRIAAGYGQPALVRLGFDFPFFSSRYRVIHVLNGPMIYLGERVLENGWGGYNPQPAIAPIIMNLDPSRGGGIHVEQSAATATITWYRLPEMGTSGENTVQLAISADGSIAMRFERLRPVSEPSLEQLYNYTAASTTGGNPSPSGAPAIFPPRLTGIHPGGRAARLAPVDFSRELPWSAAGESIVFQSYEAEYSSFLSTRIEVIAVLTVAASVLVLVLIPLLLRSNLFVPLRAFSHAMRRVEEGSMEVTVRVPFRDEIGALARSFNRMVESIRRMESSFRALAEDSQDAIAVFVDERLAYANPRAAGMTGIPAAELEGLRFDRLFRFASLPEYGVRQDAPAEARLVTAAGPLLPVELAFSGTLWRGRPAVAVQVRDITRRKREEEAAQQRQQRLLRMDKLTSLGVLAAGLAHEINVPNQVILNYASLLTRAAPQLASLLEAACAPGSDAEEVLLAGLKAGEFRDQLPGMLASIARSAGLIGGIIQDLKNFSAESSGPAMASFDLNAAVQSAADLLRPYIRRVTDRFSLELQPGLPPTRGSERRLQQVFINLILNSCQALPSRDRAVTVKSEWTDGRLRVTVHDEGVGIPPEILPRVREQFFTTRESSGGTGLGLYVCQEIVSDHEGTLELSSVPGVGTDVVVSLPAEVKP